MPLFSFEVTGKIDELALNEMGLPHVILVHEEHAPAVINSAITIIEAVDRRVELIVAAQRGQDELPGLNSNATERVRDENGLSRRRVKFPFVPWPVG